MGKIATEMFYDAVRSGDTEALRDHSGMTIGEYSKAACMALADGHKDTAKVLIPKGSLHSMLAMREYAPDHTTLARVFVEVLEQAVLEKNEQSLNRIAADLSKPDSYESHSVSADVHARIATQIIESTLERLDSSSRVVLAEKLTAAGYAVDNKNDKSEVPRTNDSRDYRQILTDKLIEQLEAGTAPWQKPWDAKVGNSRLPYNPTTSKEYRGANSIYLAMHGRDDPRWATYKQAAAQGWQVRKGEKGTLVEYWKMSDERPAVDGAGNPVMDENGKQKTVHVTLERPQVFRAVVFNAQQMDGVPELEKGPRQYEWDPVQRAEQIIEASGARIYHDQNDRAFYSPMKDEIHLPGRDQFPDQGAYYSTALHELGHWTGHASRLDRDLTGGFGSSDYAKEELRAELSSYFMADKLGIQHDPGQHAAYVKSWIKALKEDKNEIFRAAKDAEKITDYVLELDQDRAKEVGLERGGPQPVQEVQEAAQGLRVHDLPERGTSEYAALERLRNEELSVSGEISDIHASITKQMGEKARFGMLGAERTVQGVVIADMKHTVVVQIGPEEAVGLDKLEFRQLPAIGQQIVVDRTKADDKHTGRGIRLAEDREVAAARTRLDVPFKEKEQAKVHGAKWDKDAKEWYVPPGTDLKPLASWLPKEGADDKVVIVPVVDQRAKQPSVEAALPVEGKTWLAVPFKEKNEAREAGAKWDKDAKAWYAPPEASLASLGRWVPKGDMAPAPRLDPVVEFGNAIRAAGLKLDGEPEMDGKLHRVPLADGKKGNRDGAYVGYLDGRPAGSIQNWVSGEKTNWKLEGPELSAEERAQLAAQSAIKKQERAAKLSVQHNDAAGKAQARWERAKDVPEGEVTPYLDRKQVPAVGVRRDGDNTLIPVRDIDGKLWAIQTVFPEKKELAPGTEPLDKVFTTDSKKEGNFHLLGEIKPGQPVITMEGYATGASVHKATGYAVAVAFDSGNLDAVVGALKERYPTNPHFIGADDDRFAKPGMEVKNAGLTKATEAAGKHAVGVIVPKFSTEGRLTDFNDLHVSEGLAVVKQQIEQGVSQTMEQSRKMVEQLARERLGEGSAIKEPPEPNTRHTGKVLDVDSYHATQATSTKAATVHEVKDLDKLPVAGQVATIQYQNGRGKVAEKNVEQKKELQR